MLKSTWKDSKVDAKVTEAGVPKNHKYRDRARSLDVVNSFVKRYLEDYMTSKPVKVLDIATGNGIFLEVMKDQGHSVVGTEIPKSPYIPYHRSQNVLVEYHDINDLPHPFDKDSFDLVSCIGGLNILPVYFWEDLLEDLFRMAKKTVILSVGRDNAYEVNKQIIEDFALFEGWSLTLQDRSIYRWDK